VVDDGIHIRESSFALFAVQIGRWHSDSGMKTSQQVSLIRYSKGNATMSNKTRTITSILVYDCVVLNLCWK